MTPSMSQGQNGSAILGVIARSSDGYYPGHCRTERQTRVIRDRPSHGFYRACVAFTWVGDYTKYLTEPHNVANAPIRMRQK